MRKLKSRVPSRWSSTRVVGKSATLVEIPADSPMWRSAAPGKPAPDGFMPHVWKGGAVKGCIAKVTPPADVTDTAAFAMERSLYDAGAGAVRLMPSATDDKLLATNEPVETAIDVTNRSLRQVAVDRANRVTNARDLPALVQLVNESMDHGEGV